MAERRREAREAKRLMLTFVKIGEKKVTRGIALNVSRSGLFLATGTVFPRGTRLLVTEVDDPAQVAREFEVRNVQRIGDAQGMGLRAVIAGKVADATGALSLPATVSGGVPSSTSTPLPPASAAGPIPAEPPTEEPTSSENGTVFTMRFDSVENYAETYKRDFRRGGAFLRAAVLPAQDEIVLVEVIPPMPGATRLLAEAKVVFRGGGGFGVEFVDRERVLATLPLPS